MVTTWVTIRGPDDRLVDSWINHKEDLSDLGEPYLSAVIRSRQMKQIPGYTLLYAYPHPLGDLTMTDLSDPQMGELAHPDILLRKPVERWSGPFGNEYQQRNASSWPSIKNRARLFEGIFEAMEKKCNGAFPASIIEVGAGAGDNLRAIDMIYDRSKMPIRLMGCDPHEGARTAMADVAEVMPGEIAELPYSDDAADMVFTSGVLVHIPPAELIRAMSEVLRVSRRWILSIEYFNPTPQEVPYRGNSGMLWRRDFGESWLDLYPGLKIVGNGFAWKRTTGLDNVFWWLFEKPQS